MIADTDSIIEPSSRAPLRQAERQKRFGFLYSFLIVALAILLARSFQLQVVQGATYRGTAENNRVAARSRTGTSRHYLRPQRQAAGGKYRQYGCPHRPDHLTSARRRGDPNRASTHRARTSPQMRSSKR